MIYSTSKEFKRWSGLFLLVVSLLAITMAATGCFNPYSTSDKAFPKPKRLFLLVSCDTAMQVIAFLEYAPVRP